MPRRKAAPRKKAVAKRKTAKKSPQNRRRRKMHPNSLANLKKGKDTEFVSGESGNPGGRPKLASGAYLEWLGTINEVDPQGRTNAQLMAAGQGLAAISGNTGAAREIRQATEGDTVHSTVDFDLDGWSKKRQKRKQDLEEMDDEEIFD